MRNYRDTGIEGQMRVEARQRSREELRKSIVGRQLRECPRAVLKGYNVQL